MDALFDDLLGDTEEHPEIEPAPHGRDFSLRFVDVHEVERGVSLAWLCQAFTLPKSQVVARLKDCPALRSNKSGTKIYDLRTAAGYLVKPRMNVATYIKYIDPKDLPEKLKREFWAARLAEQRWRQQAGELWRSEDVIALYSELFKLIKSKAQLWEDRVTRADTLSDVQRELFLELKDDLLAEIYKLVEELEAGRMTASSIAEADDDQSEE